MGSRLNTIFQRDDYVAEHHALHTPESRGEEEIRSIKNNVKKQ